MCPFSFACLLDELRTRVHGYLTAANDQVQSALMQINVCNETEQGHVELLSDMITAEIDALTGPTGVISACVSLSPAFYSLFECVCLRQHKVSHILRCASIRWPVPRDAFSHITDAP